MGVVETATASLICSCGNAEQVRFVQHGSSYGFGEWTRRTEPVQFTVTWAERVGDAPPSASEVICRKCGAPATAETRYD